MHYYFNTDHPVLFTTEVWSGKQHWSFSFPLTLNWSSEAYCSHQLHWMMCLYYGTKKEIKINSNYSTALKWSTGINIILKNSIYVIFEVFTALKVHAVFRVMTPHSLARRYHKDGGSMFLQQIGNLLHITWCHRTIWVTPRTKHIVLKQAAACKTHKIHNQWLTAILLL